MIETESLKQWIRDSLRGAVPVMPKEVASRTLDVFEEIRKLKENGCDLHDLITYLQSRERYREAELLDDINSLDLRDLDGGIRDLMLKYDTKKKPEHAA